LKWQYDPDPFAAQLVVEERQRKAAVKKEKQSVQKDEGDDLAVLKKVMEVRMGEGLRELVENAIKKVYVLFEVLVDV
jgi:ATP-dependent RNA helicase DHX57